MSERENISHKESENQRDVTNEEVITEILESDSEEELERLREFHRLTPEQIDRFRYYARMRREVIIRQRREREEREIKNPKASDEELNLGAYKESIEPQVIKAVFAFRQKGFNTYESGFYGYDSQDIGYSKLPLEDFEFPQELVRELNKKGVTPECTPKRVILRFSTKLTVDEIQKIWEQVSQAIPDFGTPAEQCQIRTAQFFREKQVKYK